MSNQKTCGNCANFLGMGDWDLCCKDPPEEDVGFAGHLCYADTPGPEVFLYFFFLKVLHNFLNVLRQLFLLPN